MPVWVEAPDRAFAGTVTRRHSTITSRPLASVYQTLMSWVDPADSAVRVALNTDPATPAATEVKPPTPSWGVRQPTRIEPPDTSAASAALSVTDTRVCKGSLAQETL